MLPQKIESSVKPLLPISAKRRKLFIKWVLKFSAKRRANCAALCRHHKYKKQYLIWSVQVFCLEFPIYPWYFGRHFKFYKFIANNEKFVDNYLLYYVCRFEERENFPICILCGVSFFFMRAARLSTAHTLNNFFLRYRPREKRGRYRLLQGKTQSKTKILITGIKFSFRRKRSIENLKAQELLCP